MALPVSVVQADVLVCAKGGGGLLKERMALVADLWGAGLRAEMMQQAAPSLTAQYEYAHLRHIPWLLIIHGATLSAADTVKVWPLCLHLLHNDLAAAVVLATSDPVHKSINQSIIIYLMSCHLLHTASCYHTCFMSAVYSDGLSMGSLPPDVILGLSESRSLFILASNLQGPQLQQGALALSETLPVFFTLFVIYVEQIQLMFELANICTHTSLWVTQ